MFHHLELLLCTDMICPLPCPCMQVDVPDVLEVPATAVSATGAPFSPLFKDFIQRCLRKQPETRAAADTLLIHPWLAYWGISSLEDSWAMVSSYTSLLRQSSTVTGQKEGQAGRRWTLPPQFASSAGNMDLAAMLERQPAQARLSSLAVREASVGNRGDQVTSAVHNPASKHSQVEDESMGDAGT